LAVAALVLSGTALAQSLSISPGSIEDNVSAGHVHQYNFTVENTGSAQMQNVTLGNTSYLEWSSNRFTLNSSETRSVNASIYTEEDTLLNTTLETNYTVNSSTETGPNISVDVETYYRDTNASIDVLNREFELEFGESDSSAFTVANTGNETAYNVSLSGGNVTFDRDSGFQIEPGEDVLVQYDVSIPKPEENATEATNQSYEVPVTVSAANFEDKSFSADVFVPFKQYDSEEEEKSLVEQILENREALIEFCSMEENEDSLLCGNQIVRYRNVTETEYRTPQANVTLTEDEIESLKYLADQRNETLEKVLRRTKLLESYFDSELEETTSKISSNLSSVESEVQDLRRRENRRWSNVSEFIQEEKREEQGQTTNQIIIGLLLAGLIVVTRADKIKEKWTEWFGDQVY
jgi:uncharacterized membrane protein